MLKNYGWNDTERNCSHGYLIPFVRDQLAARFGRERRRILDLGCGNGAVTSLLAQLGHELVGVDASPDGVALAAKAFPSVKFVVGSMYDHDLGAATGDQFDAVISLEVIEHLLYPRELFHQASRLLKADGILIISTPYHGYWKNLALSLTDAWDNHVNVAWDGGHVKFFSMKTLSKMAIECGFEIQETAGVGRLPYLWKSMFVVARKSRTGAASR